LHHPAVTAAHVLCHPGNHVVAPVRVQKLCVRQPVNTLADAAVRVSQLANVFRHLDSMASLLTAK
jgi:hypothetical protein